MKRFIPRSKARFRLGIRRSPTDELEIRRLRTLASELVSLYPVPAAHSPVLSASRPANAVPRAEGFLCRLLCRFLPP